MPDSDAKSCHLPARRREPLEASRQRESTNFDPTDLRHTYSTLNDSFRTQFNACTEFLQNNRMEATWQSSQSRKICGQTPSAITHKMDLDSEGQRLHQGERLSQECFLLCLFFALLLESTWASE
jgi:hypothetical protein